MAADIEKYGLFTYDDWRDYATEEQFDAFNGACLKVAIGKGLVTVEEIVGYINRFLQSYNSLSRWNNNNFRKS